MNIFSALFGIFRQQGLVSLIREGRSLVGFSISAFLVSIIGGLLYGFAMGIGIGMETAVKDAIKVGVIVFLVLLFSIPIFWLAFRLLGREESFGHVAAVPLTLISSVSIILAITAPIVFLLSVLTGFSPDAVYIHIVIVDIAILVGLYLTGTLVYHAYDNPKRLIIPNIVGFLMMGVIFVVLINFLSPFLAIRPTFSVGTDRLKDGLGIGVALKASQALSAASAAEQVQYRYKEKNNNEDLIRDYTVVQLGSDSLIHIHLHAVKGEEYLNDQHIWVLDGQYYTDFDQGRVRQVNPADLASLLKAKLPPALPGEFDSASWHAHQLKGNYLATGTSQGSTQAVLVLGSETGKLTSITFGSAQEGPHAEISVQDIASPEINRSDLEASLNQAIVLGEVDQSDATMQDYIQDEAFFVVRYPRNWKASTWNSDQRKITFTTICGSDQGCPTLKVSTFDLLEGSDPHKYASDYASSLALLPEYRAINASSRDFAGASVGVLEYLFDRMVKGELQTTRHIEYIFVGKDLRYHLDFSVPEGDFETHEDLFEAMARTFTYLGSS